ncbi:HlyD family secretion protein [Roseobacter weihaiensis]|uniref:HlyD family secretion protein n=1 Tax=Roseobacter weihaiensis TaxID=2763262 RepID=UPI001D0AC0C0|nr:biotin/lipoyl-binding protein [Roseobacter sp. H9]
MIELFLCSLVTILPDYLLRRRFQGKRFGEHITFFTVWYELRWGITMCAMLTITLVTIVFYYHPSTSNVVSYFRTVTILSESAGRVDEVFVRNNQRIEAGDPIFTLDSSRQQASRDTALRRIDEVDAALVLAQADRAAAIAAVEQAEAEYQQTSDDLDRRRTLQAGGSTVVSQRDVEVLENQLAAQQGAIDAARAQVASVDANTAIALPAQRASAEAALAQAEVEIEKMTVYAGTSGTVEQFALQVGDIVNPILRPAGILVPTGSGEGRFQAGFPQISTQVIKAGGVAEIMCISKPFTIIPMVIVEVQDVIAAGQIRPSDALIDAQVQSAPGTIVAILEPLYAGQTDDIPPGSRCTANAYTSNHARLSEPDIGFGQSVFLHVVDTVGVIHAAGLRIRSLLLPLQTLVLTGH